MALEGASQIPSAPQGVPVQPSWAGLGGTRGYPLTVGTWLEGQGWVYLTVKHTAS